MTDEDRQAIEEARQWLAEQERDSANARFCDEHRGTYRVAGCVVCGLMGQGEELQKVRNEVEAKFSARLAALTTVCAEMYQVAGVLDAPAQILDQLSAAAQGGELPHETLLPFHRETRAEVRLAAVEQALRDIRADPFIDTKQLFAKIDAALGDPQ